MKNILIYLTVLPGSLLCKNIVSDSTVLSGLNVYD